MQHFRPPVIKQPCAPGRMPSFSALEEVLTVRPVLVLQPFPDVRTGMAVHHVQQHPDAHAVRLVHQVLQPVRRAVPVRRCEEVCHLVPEGAVVRVFLHRHQLYGIVSQFRNPRQDVVRKFRVCPDAFLVLRHADVRLIDQRRGGRLFHEFAVCPLKRLLRRPDLRAKAHGLLVHADLRAVSRQPVKPVFSPAHPQFHKLSVFQRVFAFQRNLPHAVVAAVQRMAVPVPFVEVTYQVNFIRARHPLPEYPSGLRPVETEVQRAVGEIRQRIRVAGDLPPFFLEPVHPQFNIAGMRRQPWIDRGNLVRSFQSADIHCLPPVNCLMMPLVLF